MDYIDELLNQYDAYGTVAEGNSFNFVEHREKKPDYVGESIFLGSYKSLKEAKKEILTLIQKRQINEGLVVDVNMDRIVWITREK